MAQNLSQNLWYSYRDLEIRDEVQAYFSGFGMSVDLQFDNAPFVHRRVKNSNILTTRNLGKMLYVIDDNW